MIDNVTLAITSEKNISDHPMFLRQKENNNELNKNKLYEIFSDNLMLQQFINNFVEHHFQLIIHRLRIEKKFELLDDICFRYQVFLL